MNVVTGPPDDERHSHGRVQVATAGDITEREVHTDIRVDRDQVSSMYTILSYRLHDTLLEYRNV